jgi:hypothetical protein
LILRRRRANPFKRYAAIKIMECSLRREKVGSIFIRVGRIRIKTEIT